GWVPLFESQTVAVPPSRNEVLTVMPSNSTCSDFTFPPITAQGSARLVTSTSTNGGCGDVRTTTAPAVLPSKGVPDTDPCTPALGEDDEPQAAASSRSANRFIRSKLPCSRFPCHAARAWVRHLTDGRRCAASPR